MVSVGPIDLHFDVALRRDAKLRAWTVAVLPESAAAFGTRGPIKVGGTIDGHPFRATLLPMGDGTHMLPIKATLREAIAKDDQARIQVHLQQRFT